MKWLLCWISVGAWMTGAFAQTAVRTDPGSLAARYDHVVVLEHDSDGVRYSYNAPLSQAAGELLEARALPGYSPTWDDELLRLWGLTGEFEQIRSLVPQMTLTDSRRDWLLAAAFYIGGEAAAREAAVEIHLDRSATRRAFYGAAGALEAARQYDEARQLMTLASVDRSEARNRTRRLKMLGRMKRHETESLTEDSPEDGARILMAVLMRPTAGGPRLGGVLSRTSARVFAREGGMFGGLTAFGAAVSSNYLKAGYSVDQAIDRYLSEEETTVTGSALTGYLVHQRNGADQLDGFFVIERGNARLLATPQMYALAGPEALARANAGLEEEAQVLINWAAKYVSPTDDPLAAPVFLHFKDEVGYAAAALSASLGDADAVTLLSAGRKATTSPARQMDFDIALAAAYFAQHDWQSLAPVAARLAGAFPDSRIGLEYRSAANRGLRKAGAGYGD